MSGNVIEGLAASFMLSFLFNLALYRYDSICTTDKILKLNNIYTYNESGHVDIVRLVGAYHEKEYLYCTLYFFNRYQIITVSQRMQPGAHVIWQIMDNKEYDELMSRRLWREVEKQNLV